jgi:hypothetical protein
MHMPWFSSVIRVKEKAKPALAKNRWHLPSLTHELCGAQTSMMQAPIRRLLLSRNPPKGNLPSTVSYQLSPLNYRLF